jgi:hypothetical protein
MGEDPPRDRRTADLSERTTVPSGAAQGVTPAPDALPARYHVRGRLGAGAMGEVHLCYDERIGREVAVKTMRIVGNSAPSLQARFVHEARLQGALEHPAIVPIHGHRRAPRGRQRSRDGGAGACRVADSRSGVRRRTTRPPARGLGSGRWSRARRAAQRKRCRRRKEQTRQAPHPDAHGRRRVLIARRSSIAR